MLRIVATILLLSALIIVLYRLIVENEPESVEKGVRTAGGPFHVRVGTFQILKSLLGGLRRALPAEYDWRKQGLVTDVKAQGALNVSDIFAAVGAVESGCALRTGQLYTLSEQEVVDCSSRRTALYPGSTFEGILTLGGIQLNATYPYIAKDLQECRFNQSEVAVKIDGYVRLHDEDIMARYLMKHGSVVATLDARHSLRSYKSGIVTDTECSTSEFDLVALIVGFGTENGVRFWIVKNSWGKEWGEAGYFRIERGKNTCGIGSHSFAPYFFV
ncbi:hypothetical protein QR680_013482 [Steinernema hermaphroditum]|uniref:Peptidase C1A papain C-terminal domain-containing protein n=1 Tax=Steinernema hermaphroditum TaxID=289476 RepID=A0AA39M2L2_9BILA|nr:hypothetical protein QR680_013482 [Steinernema hermaphroditum]